ALKAVEAWVEPGHDGRWLKLDGVPLRPVGMAGSEALIDYPARSHPGYRLLAELFAFPEKFGFFDIDLRQAGRLGGRRFTLHLILAGMPPDSVPARLLETLTAANLPLGCTPVVNLFRHHA